jgi:pyridoxal phosphate enzyme (YggS family)
MVWRRIQLLVQTAMQFEPIASDASYITENLSNIRARIATAATAAGRDPAAITLIAVSKTHGPAALAAALAAGQTIFGENRVQEAAEKFPCPGARLHLIGPLQTNKAAAAIRLADSIDSLDRDKLSDAIARAADSTGAPIPDLLIQINIGSEPQKSGILPADADRFIRAAQNRFGPAIKGLMCIPPIDAAPAPYFRQLAKLADAHGLVVRSMGMSNDFETAIACGATHIRVGSAIFGSRTKESPR